MLQFFIFSYNRGQFLKNCLESIQQCAASCPVSVLDDDSTDPETREILASLPPEVSLIQPGLRTRNRHGGLYANMQRALELAEPGSRALFIQDDMMLVRSLRAEDFEYIDQFFQRFSGAAFLNPVFLKGARKRRDYRITRLHPDYPVYFRDYPGKKHPGGLSYADVVLADVDRLRQSGWRFGASEAANAWQARRLFGDMGFMAWPFIMFLPQVGIYRGGFKTLGARMAEKRSGTRPKAFQPMSQAQLEALFSRDLRILPHAEQFLECRDPAVRKPFVYSAVSAFPVPYCLHKCELLARRWLRRS